MVSATNGLLHQRRRCSQLTKKPSDASIHIELSSPRFLHSQRIRLRPSSTKGTALILSGMYHVDGPVYNHESILLRMTDTRITVWNLTTNRRGKIALKVSSKGITPTAVQKHSNNPQSIDLFLRSKMTKYSLIKMVYTRLLLLCCEMHY